MNSSSLSQNSVKPSTSVSSVRFSLVKPTAPLKKSSLRNTLISNVFRIRETPPKKSGLKNGLPVPPSNKQNMSPDEDWRLWFHPKVPERRHVWKTKAETEEKRHIIHNIIEMVPHVPHRLDTARLKNVLFDLNVHFRVASLLPTLLMCEDRKKLDSLGDDVNRTLQVKQVGKDFQRRLLHQCSRQVVRKRMAVSTKKQVNGLNHCCLQRPF